MKVPRQHMETILNEVPGVNTSDKYALIQTKAVIDKFKTYGFNVSSYQEARFRKEDKRNKVKHLVRMKIDGQMGVDREIVIMNSHDGTSSLKLNFGLFRAVCQNQLVFGDKLLPTEKIYHSKQNPWEQIESFADLVHNKLDEEQKLREYMMGHRLSAYDIEQFAYDAVALKEKDMSIVLDPMAVNLVRRPEDIGKTLWLTYQRIQENIIKGDSYRKLSIRTDENGESFEKYVTAKKVSDHQRSIQLNKDLHSLAMSYV